MGLNPGKEMNMACGQFQIGKLLGKILFLYLLLIVDTKLKISWYAQIGCVAHLN